MPPYCAEKAGRCKGETKKCEIYTCSHGAHSLLQSRGAFAEQVALPDRVCYDPKQRCRMRLSRSQGMKEGKTPGSEQLEKMTGKEESR